MYDKFVKSRHPGFRPRFQPVGLTGRRVGDYTPEGESRGPEGFYGIDNPGLINLDSGFRRNDVLKS